MLNNNAWISYFIFLLEFFYFLLFYKKQFLCTINGTICVQSGEGARSPTVFAAIVSYIMNILDVFGIELLHTTVRIYELCAIYFLTFALHGFTFKLSIAAKY